MKARLPKGYGSGGANNIQQLARQAQKLQDDMEAASKELETKEYGKSACIRFRPSLFFPLLSAISEKYFPRSVPRSSCSLVAIISA